ncbi:unnamed protein product [Owenia fusiformis]|uniref:Uncharacterized protein n=1 Tax=Owenia fusiformis TaxID=6347 RepID=A0A8J1Y0X0_OWEFU|nr:unnamed protein product [Owenia fusiformis]
MKILSFFGAFLVLAVLLFVQGDEDQCHPIVQPFCKQLQYAGGINSTSVEIIRQHRLTIFQQMSPILRSQCSPYLLKFICATEVPLCSQTHVEAMGIPDVIKSPRPCRDMCLDVYKSCARMLRIRARPWPGKLLCHKFPQRNCLAKDEESFDFISRPLNDFFDETLFKTDLQENGAMFDGGLDAEPMEFILDDEITNPESNQESRVFGLEFKTTVADGSIVAFHTTEAKGVIIVALKEGRLVYMANCGEKEIIFKQSNTRYDDGEWHEAFVPHFKPINALNVSRVFGLEFKTTVADGSIVAFHTTEAKGVIIVALKEGRLVYMANCGEKEIIFKQSNTRYDDGEWHEISVPLDWRMLNGASENMQDSETTHGSCQEIFNKATVGAAKLTTNQSGILSSIVASFTGCIRNVKHGEVVPEMAPTSVQNQNGTMRQWSKCQQ